MHNVYRTCAIELDDMETRFEFRTYGGETVNIWRQYNDTPMDEIDLLMSSDIPDSDDETFARICAD